MGTLALVLYVLGAVPIYVFIEEDVPSATVFDRVFVSAFWPLVSAAALAVTLYKGVFKK